MKDIKIPRVQTNRKLEFKSKAFAKSYIKNKFNGTATAKELYNVKNDRVAESIASDNLSKPIFQRAIEQELERQGITDEFLTREHKKVIVQDRNLPAKNTAINMAYELKGSKAPDKSINLNINRELKTEEDIDKAIEDTLKELESLKSSSGGNVDVSHNEGQPLNDVSEATANDTPNI